MNGLTQKWCLGALVAISCVAMLASAFTEHGAQVLSISTPVIFVLLALVQHITATKTDAVNQKVERNALAITDAKEAVSEARSAATDAKEAVASIAADVKTVKTQTNGLMDAIGQGREEKGERAGFDAGVKQEQDRQSGQSGIIR